MGDRYTVLHNDDGSGRRPTAIRNQSVVGGFSTVVGNGDEENAFSIRRAQAQNVCKKEEKAVYIEQNGRLANPTIDERGDGNLLRTTSTRDKNTNTSTRT